MVNLWNGTRYSEYAMENKILDRNNDFIGKKSGTARFSFAFVYNGVTYGIWNDYKQGKVFVSLDFLQESPFVFSMTLSDSKPNIMMLKSLKKYKFWRTFLDNFSIGIVYYESQKIKHNFYELLKVIRSI